MAVGFRAAHAAAACRITLPWINGKKFRSVVVLRTENEGEVMMMMFNTAADASKVE